MPMIDTLPATDDFSVIPVKPLSYSEYLLSDSAATDLVRASVSTNTQRSYRGALERLDVWLDGRPLDDNALAAWITHLHDKGLSAATASLAVAAVRFRAKMTGQNERKDPVGPATQRTLAGIRRISRSRDQLSGVLWEEADTIVEAAIREKTLRGLRDAALIAVASDALLRVSEMVDIDVGDIERDSDGSAILHIRRSKTDQEGRGATCYLGRRTVKVLDTWMTSAGIGQDKQEAVFRSLRKGGNVAGRLSDRSTRSIVTVRCGGNNKGRVSGHSLRIGSALSLARAGASLVEMQQAGRWKSPDMPAWYTRGEVARRGAVARLRYGQ